MPATLRGLTWGHRRAIEPLCASADMWEAETGVRVDWRARALAEFEHQPFEAAVRSTDLIVFDHPHVGDVVAGDLLLPLDEALASVDGALDDDGYVGPSLASYRWADRLWAVPVDGATVHAVHRPDLLDRLDAEPPADWDGAVTLMRRAKRAGFTSLLAARGHHLLLTLASLMANVGRPWPTEPGTPFALDRHALEEAIDRLDQALDSGDRTASLAANAIDAHERLATDPTAAYCPAAYGYATYGEDGFHPHRLGFSDFPDVGADSARGTAVGGAGVGVARGCADPDAAFAYLRHLAGRDTQYRIFAAASGQPARVEAWLDGSVDRAFNGFFSGVARTMASAWVRPRFPGYSRLEQDLARPLHAHMSGEIGRAAAVRAMLARADAVGLVG